MKSLQQLQEMSQSALANAELVEFAQNLTPTAAYEQAIAHHYSEDLARSCRFLAIIQRDHGSDVIASMLTSVAQSGCDSLLTEMVIPGIKALEVIVGDTLKIVEPDKNRMTLVEYLEKSKTCSLDVELEIGEYKINLAYKVANRGEQLVIPHKFIVFSPIGEELTNKGGELWTSADLRDPNKVRQGLYSFLKQSLFSLYSWPHNSAVIVIRDDLEKRGEKVSVPLWKAVEADGEKLWALERYGLVQKIQELGAKIRAQAVADNVSQRGLAILDYEIAVTRKHAEKMEKQLTPSVSLIDKFHQGMFGIAYAVVPGPKAEKTYNFLLHAEFVSSGWLKTLQSKGYGGSMVILFFNIDSGMYVAETGQCDAFLLQQHGIREKDDILDKAQEAMESSQTARGNANVPKLPKFKYDPYLGYTSDDTCGGFDKFLDKHFSLK